MFHTHKEMVDYLYTESKYSMHALDYPDANRATLHLWPHYDELKKQLEEAHRRMDRIYNMANGPEELVDVEKIKWQAAT